MALPSQEILKKTSQKIKNIPNRQGEYKRKIHYGCYLLCSQSGLRISEAVKFDLSAKTKKGLYRIEKPKGKSERYVYVSKEVIRELKTNNWQPNQTNRHSFYHFLRKIKRELGINKNVELSPHTLRRSFTTYHANSGAPLPLLQKLLGHSSIRTTALYWHDTDGDGDNDTADILRGKKWLERPKPSQNKEKEPPKPPTAENFPSIKKKSVINSIKPSKQDNSLPLIKVEEKPAIANYQPKLLISEISPKNQGKFSLNTGEEFPIITNKREKEEFLLQRIKNLEEQLSKVQAENNHLKLENKHLKALIKKEQETETKVIQSLPFKGKK